MIERLDGFPENVIAVDCKGHVTRDDYEKILIPTVERTLAKHDKVRLYYRIGPDFEGIDPGAVLEDMKVGFAHLSRWERIAVVTDVEWIRLTIRAFAFLIPSTVRFFTTAQESEARNWIIQ
jgi:hypothetical protein